MKCADIETILLTDYIDGELSSAARERIDSHLAVCRECRALLAEVTAVTTPLGQARHEPREQVWKNIEKAIVGKPVVDAWYQTVWEYVRENLRPRPAFALGTVMAVALVAGWFVVHQSWQKTEIAQTSEYIEEQVSFLAALDSQDIFISDDEETSSGDEESGYSALL